MRTETWTPASIKAHLKGIQDQVVGLIPIKFSPLKEAHARGLGFRTEAALADALKTSPELSPTVFDVEGFIDRLAELTSVATAEAISAMLDGVGLDVSIRKYPDARQRAHEHFDVAYDVEVRVTGLPAEALAGDVFFHLPQFGTATRGEPYRIDSAHDRRVTPDYPKTSDGGRNTLVAKVVDGHWHGGLYIYAPEHQIDDGRCLTSVRAALAQAILPQLPLPPLGTRCFIFRPDGYDLGAWRVEVRLAPGVWHYWGVSPFHFDVPQFAKRLFIFKSCYKVDVDVGRFVDGAWIADLYTNGIAEAENPTGLTQVKRALLSSVNEQIRKAGYVAEPASALTI